MFRDNPGTTRAQGCRELETSGTAVSYTEMSFTSLLSDRVLSKNEAPAAKSTPSSLTKVCSYSHGQAKCHPSSLFGIFVLGSRASEMASGEKLYDQMK